MCLTCRARAWSVVMSEVVCLQIGQSLEVDRIWRCSGTEESSGQASAIVFAGQPVRGG